MRWIRSCLLVCLLVSAITAAAEPPGYTLEGAWQGTLAIAPAGFKLRIVFKVAVEADGSLSALMDSPDQGAYDIAVDRVSLEDGIVKFEVDVAAGYFEGTLSDDGSTIEGEWHQSGQDLALTLEHSDEALVLNRPQEPQEPFPYKVEEVDYSNEAAGITLAGTLTFPEGEGPFTAAILISGSGAQDRDEFILGHRPFLVLADHLTRNGIAVLRVDDRGVGGSTGDHLEATSEDFAGDVLAGVAYLKTREEIHPGRIGLIGHSEGGIIAPMAAARSDDVAYIVLMAAPGLIGEDLLYLQAERIAAAGGIDADIVERNRAIQSDIFTILRQDIDDAAMEERLTAVFREAYEALPEEEREASGFDPDEYFKARVANVLNPWFRFFLTYDPAPTLGEVRCPVLAVTGENDLQAPPEPNLAIIGEALNAGGNQDVTIMELPGLNHLFQTSETGAPSEYGQIEETMSPMLLDAVTEWINGLYE
jgi:pimeloyl-ACP methyl ester carboxylesterase